MKVKGVTKQLMGGFVGGAGNAIYESYVAPMLPASVSDSADYVKAAIGVGISYISKNEIVQGIGNGILTVACSNIVAGLLSGEEDKTPDKTPTKNPTGDATSGIFGARPARYMIGRTPDYVRNAKRGIYGVAADPSTAMVSGTKVVC